MLASLQLSRKSCILCLDDPQYYSKHSELYSPTVSVLIHFFSFPAVLIYWVLSMWGFKITEIRERMCIYAHIVDGKHFDTGEFSLGYLRIALFFLSLSLAFLPIF
jgi:hypothetical protein